MGRPAGTVDRRFGAPRDEDDELEDEAGARGLAVSREGGGAAAAAQMALAKPAPTKMRGLDRKRRRLAELEARWERTHAPPARREAALFARAEFLTSASDPLNRHRVAEFEEGGVGADEGGESKETTDADADEEEEEEKDEDEEESKDGRPPRHPSAWREFWRAACGVPLPSECKGRSTLRMLEALEREDARRAPLCAAQHPDALAYHPGATGKCVAELHFAAEFGGPVFQPRHFARLLRDVLDCVAARRGEAGARVRVRVAPETVRVLLFAAEHVATELARNAALLTVSADRVTTSPEDVRVALAVGGLSLQRSRFVHYMRQRLFDSARRAVAAQLGVGEEELKAEEYEEDDDEDDEEDEEDDDEDDEEEEDEEEDDE
jgi:histone H3/H4